MRAQTLPAAAGWRWLVSGFAIFRRNPPLLGLLFLTYWLTVLMLNIVPVIGALAASLAIPGLSVGLMQAARNIERGQPASFATLFGGLKENTRTLVALGALYLCCTLGILGVSALVDGGELMRFMLGSPADRAALENGDFTLPALVVLLLLAPLLMAYWFAPVLAAWHGLSTPKALFFSFVACWINWRPFLAYGLALTVVTAIAPAVLLGILLLLFPQALALVTALVMLPMVMVVGPSVFASFYASYRDIFGISEIV